MLWKAIPFMERRIWSGRITKGGIRVMPSNGTNQTNQVSTVAGFFLVLAWGVTFWLILAMA